MRDRVVHLSCSQHIHKENYLTLCYYLHTNTAVVVLRSTTVVKLLYVSSYYTGMFSFASQGSNGTTVIECAQPQGV